MEKINKRKKSLKTGRLRVGSITQRLLLEIGEKLREGADILDLVVTPLPDFLKKAYFRPPYTSFEPQKIRNAFGELKRRGYVKEEIVGKNRRIIFTSKGKVELSRSKILQKKKQKWDNKWRAVIFDIAESKRRDRDLIRRELKWLDFKELQKSVWIFPFDAEKELKDLIEFLRINTEGDIRFLTVEKISIDEDLKKHFKLHL